MTKQEQRDKAREEVRKVRGIMHQQPLDLRTYEEWLDVDILEDTHFPNSYLKINYDSQHNKSTFSTK